MMHLSNPTDLVISLSLICGCIVCLVIAKEDLVSRRIPNKLLLLLIIFGLIRYSNSASITEFSIHLLVGIGGIVLAFPLYAFGKMGAGDVKYLGVSVFFCGYELIPEYFMALMICGIAISVISLSEAAKYVWDNFTSLIGFPKLQNLIPAPTSIPFGVPIALTVLIVTLPILKVSF